jgi:hypothetical protein
MELRRAAGIVLDRRFSLTLDAVRVNLDRRFTLTGPPAHLDRRFSLTLDAARASGVGDMAMLSSART